MIAQHDSRGRERRAAFTHAFHQGYVVVVHALRGVDVANVGITDVLGLAQRADETQVQERSQLEIEAALQSVVLLAQPRQRVVGEAVDVVEVEARPLRHVCNVVVIGAEVGMQPATQILIAHFTGEDVLIVQVAHKVVVHLGSRECRGG